MIRGFARITRNSACLFKSCQSQFLLCSLWTMKMGWHVKVECGSTAHYAVFIDVSHLQCIQPFTEITCIGAFQYSPPIQTSHFRCQQSVFHHSCAIELKSHQSPILAKHTYSIYTHLWMVHSCRWYSATVCASGSLPHFLGNQNVINALDYNYQHFHLCLLSSPSNLIWMHVVLLSKLHCNNNVIR